MALEDVLYKGRAMMCDKGETEGLVLAGCG